MVSIQDQLAGALIGLARPTDGNAHLISPSATAALIDGLAALRSGADRAALEKLLERIGEEKRKMVPSCFYCASPCGKNDNYDMDRLRDADREVREMKTQLLQGIQEMAVSLQGQPGGAAEGFLYKALIVIGIDEFTPEDLRPILQEMGEISSKMQ